jgi:hypothetical protein
MNTVTNTDNNQKITWDDLVYREFPEAKNEFLRCQVGVVEYEMRDTTPWCSSRKRLENLPLFHLLGFGETMEEANEMVERRFLRKTA